VAGGPVLSANSGKAVAGPSKVNGTCVFPPPNGNRVSNVADSCCAGTWTVTSEATSLERWPIACANNTGISSGGGAT
jgi:hypothetical protein